MSRRRIAYYGGSFNPCHIGHQMTALQSLTLLDVDTLIVAPAYVHSDGKQLIEFEHRLEMCRRMVRPFAGYNKSVIVSRIEESAYLYGASKGVTSDVLRHLRRGEFADAHFTLVLGSDIKESIASWKGFDDLAEMKKAGNLSFFFAERWLDVSSTKVRALYRSDEPEISKVVPQDIHWYIQNHCLYR